MPAPHPPEFRHRAVELAQQAKPVAELAKDACSWAEPMAIRPTLACPVLSTPPCNYLHVINSRLGL
jgi:hypothetical protein